MKRGVYLLALVSLLVGVSGFAAGDAEPDGSGKRVFVLPIEGPIDKGMLYVFRRAFTEAEQASPDAIIIELNTPGGALSETREIIDWIRAQKKRSPVYAYVNTEAISAGSIISLSTNAIYMAPTSSIGDAMPIMIGAGGSVKEMDSDYKEKIRSYVRGWVRGLAQENGYNEDLAESMVDPDKEFKIGDTVICPKGKLLTLTSNEAVEVVAPNTKPLLATAIVKDLPALLAKVGLPGAKVIRFEEESADRLARWITMIGPLLFAAGMIGIYIEMRTPGFGLPGIAGAVCLGIYFFGHHVAGLAGWEDVALIMIGLVLLALEIFVIPGFGIAGISGIACIAIGAFMALIPHLPTVAPLQGVEAPEMGSYVDEALLKLTVSFLLIGILAWLVGKILPKTQFYSALVLEAGLSNDQGYVSSDVELYRSYLGREGLARTMLRPAGTAEFGDERLDVVTSGDLIPKGSRLRVIRVEGSRVVVERIEDTSGEA
jgi:membrane-bound serine protease (ClpP class)